MYSYLKLLRKLNINVHYYRRKEKENMKMVDLYCCAGAGAMGYHKAGFDEIIGVDIVDRPNYPFKFVKMDAIEFIKSYDWSDVDFVHASPPCQRYTRLKYLSGNVEEWEENHVDLVDITREHLEKLGIPYVIENVSGSPLREPIKLFGSQFKGLFTQRERWFESNVKLKEPDTPRERHQTPQLGQGIGEDGFVTVAGLKPLKWLNETQTKLYYGIALGGIDWMDLNELTQAIPPAYTEFIGKQIIEHIKMCKFDHEIPNEKQTLFDMEAFTQLVIKYLKEEA